jgi:hypothetical protein
MVPERFFMNRLPNKHFILLMAFHYLNSQLKRGIGLSAIVMIILLALEFG